MISALEAYNTGAATYNKFQAERAKGASETEAAGAIAGTIGGGAACVAVGAAVVAPLCASLGGTIGRAIGGLFSSGAEARPNYAPAICAHVERALDDLWQDAAANGVSLPRAQLQAWFADGADRAALARPGAADIQILGELGAPGTRLRINGARQYPISPSGLWTLPNQGKGMPPYGLGSTTVEKDWRAYRYWMPWNPTLEAVPISTGISKAVCLFSDVTKPQPVIDMASIGLAAVAARIADAAALRQQNGADTITIRGGVATYGSGISVTTIALALAAGAAAIWYWKRRKSDK